MAILMTALFCVITLVPREEKHSIKGPSCDAEHTLVTLVNILLGFLQVKAILISQSISHHMEIPTVEKTLCMNRGISISHLQ